MMDTARKSADEIAAMFWERAKGTRIRLTAKQVSWLDGQFRREHRDLDRRFEPQGEIRDADGERVALWSLHTYRYGGGVIEVTPIANLERQRQHDELLAQLRRVNDRLHTATRECHESGYEGDAAMAVLGPIFDEAAPIADEIDRLRKAAEAEGQKLWY